MSNKHIAVEIENQTSATGKKTGLNWQFVCKFLA